MKKALIGVLFLVFSQQIYAQTEVGPEGSRLFVVLLAAILLIVVLTLIVKPKSKFWTAGNSIFRRKKIKLQVFSDRLYYPDFLELVITNTGNADIDIDQPLLVFDNFWFKRKFKIKGTNKYSFYPLLLEKGKVHSIKIDINRFYRHDNRLKKFPKTKIIINEVSGKKLSSKSVYLRKTLFKF